MNLPKVGDKVTYYGHCDAWVTGILAERAISPLTGNPRYRVVDSAGEMKDEEAGRWIGIENVIRIDAPNACSRCQDQAGAHKDRDGWPLCDACAAVVLPDEANHPVSK